MATYAVGDIHGQYHLLAALLDRVGFDYKNDRLISVGDVIDRGTDTGLLLEKLYEGSRDGWFSAIKGNHEELLLSYWKDPDRHRDDYLDPGFGGRPTVEALEKSKKGKKLLEWIGTWPLCMETDTFILVHASLPRIQGSRFGDIELCPLRKEGSTGFHTCLWARPPEIYSSFDQRVVISGHNIVSRPGPAKEGTLLIDTGAYRTGILTFFRLEDHTFHQVQGKPRVQA
ncbi:MAG: Putative metallophosphoesterase [Leptospirillum sp. Group II 'C75']|jgi:serine/threonine protein phosphatase 1|uniref:metallophosphoesterase n=1 Tax=Leptospirillum sp. Group II 'CF-1' TaxID=1660083 RepID=UPI0000F0CF36|nr:metallophosphoesterase [Leptospirillum sp. Group II 'CF-1']AKS23214.1 metallophosphoesterase [Leptospirillum sp. Group II 'CF-1']EAY56018.1 MAG: putative metallophosphoesterase [Leptospirillum rubarum]EIJ76893.1 MAG: Putative metallophosphoesterase [Leptospirillum sp. Group II 'C75']